MRRYIFVFMLFVALFLNGCILNPYSGNRPCDQKHTKWESEDKKIYFTVDEKGNGDGYLLVNDQKKHIQFVTGRARVISILFDDEIKEYETVIDIDGRYLGTFELDEPQIENWVGDFCTDDTFIATVLETTYFQKGQKIKFNRID